MKIQIDRLKNKMFIPREAIALPTMGAEIEASEFVTGETMGGRTGDFYRIQGYIHPVDPAAQDIHFQIGLPVEWNGKVVQFGGGGLDGFTIPVEWLTVGRAPQGPSPMKEGYLVVDCDGGHAIDFNDLWSATWALNEETLVNFAYAAQKKVRDAVCYFVHEISGDNPKRIYFAGGSNGGRECMKTMQKFPEDYDGAVCLYPVLWWVLKVLADNRNGNLLGDLGEEAWIGEQTYRSVQALIMEKCDELDGVRDGIISNYGAAKEKETEIIEALSDVLNEKQLQVLRSFASPMRTSYLLGYGETELPGYALFQGAPLVDKNNNQFGNCAEERAATQGAAQVIACMIMGDENYPTNGFDPEQHPEEVKRASELLDAYSTNLDGFCQNGRKMILVQGAADPLVTPEGSVRYYQELQKRYGKEKLDQFLKFYLVPGYGHGNSEMFLMDVDLLEALDLWVEKGIAPGVLIAADGNEGACRKRPLYEYPFYPKYDGTGDINDARSFRPAAMKEGSNYQENNMQNGVKK